MFELIFLQPSSGGLFDSRGMRRLQRGGWSPLHVTRAFMLLATCCLATLTLWEIRRLGESMAILDQDLAEQRKVSPPLAPPYACSGPPAQVVTWTAAAWGRKYNVCILQSTG